MSKVSYGYRRLHVLLAREGWTINHKRVYRLYRQEGLGIPKEKAPSPRGMREAGDAANGPEFISKDLDRWAYWNKVELDFSRPGKPSDNALVEAFNSRFRQECLNEHWFMSIEDVRSKITEWQQEYNTERPHSALGYRSPTEIKAVNSSPKASAA